MENRCFFYRAQVLEVYDGDTITVDIDLGFSMVLKKHKVRLYGIDTAEMKGKDENLKKRAKEARDWLREMCLGKSIYLDSRGADKYGRWLGNIFTQDGICLNEELVRLGYAVSYDGGKKNQELLKD